MLPPEKEFIEHMKRLNAKTTDRVVCYDHNDSQWAARAVWMFKVMGHPNV